MEDFLLLFLKTYIALECYEKENAYTTFDCLVQGFISWFHTTRNPYVLQVKDIDTIEKLVRSETFPREAYHSFYTIESDTCMGCGEPLRVGEGFLGYECKQRKGLTAYRGIQDTHVSL